MPDQIVDRQVVDRSSLDWLIGQEKAVKLLRQAVIQKRIAPAYLFSGTGGIGKSIAACGFAELILGCQPGRTALDKHPDLIWVEPTYSDRGNLLTVSEAAAQNLKKRNPPQIRVEQVRHLTKFLYRRPLKSDRLVVIIEDAHLLSETSANALLKTLEEPGNATLILIAPESDSLLNTIVSRCQKLRFTPLANADLQLVLNQNNYSEICARAELMAMAQGSPGNAIIAWQNLQSISPELIEVLQRIVLQQKPQNILDAMITARNINEELDLTTQLWLVDYLQHYGWQYGLNSDLAATWEETKKYLLAYVQPRLVWESVLTGFVV